MKKKKYSYLYFVAIILVLAIIPSSQKVAGRALSVVAEPLSRTFSSAAFSSSRFLTGLRQISSLRDENQELSNKIKSFQIDKTELEELRHENEVLKKQLGFLEEHKETSLLPARIIGREPFGALDKIIIDKGEQDGVRPRRAVVSDGSLVGRVTEVTANQAKITLITSKDSIIQAMLQNSRTLGIIRGSLEGVKLENIPQDTTVAENEAVITSGLGGEISPGILIGWTTKDSSSKSEIYKVLNIDIASDLNKLEYVFVVK